MFLAIHYMLYVISLATLPLSRFFFALNRLFVRLFDGENEKKNFVLIYQRHSIRVVDSSVLLLSVVENLFMFSLCSVAPLRFEGAAAADKSILWETRWFLRCVIRLM